MAQPKAVRNFWLQAQAGEGKPVALGPKGVKGRLEATLKVRENGEISPVELDIICAERDGILHVRIQENGREVYHREFVR